VQIQVALDRIPLEHALLITEAVRSQADWVEVGTSLIKQFGMAAVREVVAAAGRTPVLADLKTADDARFEFGLAFDAGAASATVLALADDATIDLAVEVARDRGAEVLVDLMGVDEGRRWSLARRLPPEVVLGAHVSKDAQARGGRPVDLLGDWASGRRIALAGGLTADDVPALAGRPDLRVIVGSAVTRAQDPVGALHDLRRAAGQHAGAAS
jgi:3-hexulose-6-phosphate synthase